MLLFILLLFFICRCFSFCCCNFIWFPGYFAMSPALYPGFSDLRRPPPALSSTSTTFYCFFFSSTASITVLSGHFLPTHRRFLPYVLSQHFWHIPTFLAHFWHFGTTYFYQGFTGSRQSLSWKLQGFILILKTQTRSISLFDSE